MIGLLSNPERSEGALSNRCAIRAIGVRGFDAPRDLLGVVLLVSLVHVFGCTDPHRPASVPKSAVWVVNPQGPSGRGAFIQCSVEAQRNVNRCLIWSRDGVLECERDFRLQPGDRYARSDELKFHVWDGEEIFLDAKATKGELRKLSPLMPCRAED